MMMIEKKKVKYKNKQQSGSSPQLNPIKVDPLSSIDVNLFQLSVGRVWGQMCRFGASAAASMRDTQSSFHLKKKPFFLFHSYLFYSVYKEF